MGIRVSTASSSPVIVEGLGVVIYDQHGANVIKSGSVYSQRGFKGVNQDSAVICQGYGSKDGVFCGVFDGHGKSGHLVSKILRQQLPKRILEQIMADENEKSDENPSDNQVTEDGDLLPNRELVGWEKTFVNAFEYMDEELKLIKRVDSSFSGSAAVVVLKQGDDLLIANLGDSRAVLGTKTEKGLSAVQLTVDLKPGTPDEAARIRKSNGRVFALRAEPGMARAWLPRVECPGIAMSRCFGDFVMKNHGLICIPVVTQHSITPDDLFVVLATDGVWDVLSNDEVVSIVSRVKKQEKAAKAVVEAAAAAWMTRMPLCAPDDCTAICLFFPHNDQIESDTPKPSL